VSLFELDLPELFDFKESVLAQQGAIPKCSRTVVAGDLRDNWSTRLIAAGFMPKVPSAWVAEGVLAYLSNNDAVRLLTTVGELSEPGSELSLEYDEPGEDSPLNHVRAIRGMDTVTSMWQGGLNVDPRDWLRRYDWQVRAYDRVSLGERYRRVLAHAAGGYLIAMREPDPC
jgi:methyltransferase (TIGR00027 family)